MKEFSQKPDDCASRNSSWHTPNMPSSRIDSRFLSKGGRAADLTIMAEVDPGGPAPDTASGRCPQMDQAVNR